MRPALIRRLRLGRPPTESEPVVPPETAKDYPALEDDIETLDRVVGPAYREADLAALLHQHRYRRQQVLILLGSTLVTGLGGLQALLPGRAWPGVLLLVLGAAVTWFSKTAGELKELDEFLDERTKAERLRAMYFRFLSRTGRFDVPDPLAALERAVVAVRKGEEPR